MKRYFAITSIVALIGLTITAGIRHSRQQAQGLADEISERAQLPVLGQLEPFDLRDQDGTRFTLEKMQGVVTVVNFIFTRCPGICPMLTTQMAKLERDTRALGGGVRFLSVSVDPEYDTPQRLKAYARKRSLDLTRWTFVTGPLEAVEKVVIEGFRTAMGKRQVAASQEHASEEEEPDLMQIVHGEHFIVVDSQGQLRAFHTAKNEEDLKVLFDTLKQLL